jgi:hypothetical protein
MREGQIMRMANRPLGVSRLEKHENHSKNMKPKVGQNVMTQTSGNEKVIRIALCSTEHCQA